MGQVIDERSLPFGFFIQLPDVCFNSLRHLIKVACKLGKLVLSSNHDSFIIMAARQLVRPALQFLHGFNGVVDDRPHKNRCNGYNSKTYEDALNAKRFYGVFYSGHVPNKRDAIFIRAECGF